MRVATVVHQQVGQIKWHALACLALIMVLPLEEATASLLDGGGFYALGTVALSIMLGPLLAGLIACANVQADLNDRRYIFWRSKPVGVKRFIALKYATGLIIALAIQACPIVFDIVTSAVYGEGQPVAREMGYYMMLPALLSVMTYSLCFACNVVVRKTARSWLVGMAVACLLLLLPFVLPLGYKDVVSDVLLWVPGFYLAIMLVGSVGAFVFAILAAQYDLHLKTNLKGLLWTGATVVFGLMMFAGGQVANIKVLAEKDMPEPYVFDLMRLGDDVFVRGSGFIDTDENKITFEYAKHDWDVAGDFGVPTIGNFLKEGYETTTYPSYKNRKFYRLADGIYTFVVHVYYVEEEERDNKGKSRKIQISEKLYFRWFKRSAESWDMVYELDLSDCIRERRARQHVVCDLIDDRLVAIANRSCLMLDVTEPSKPKIIEKKIDVVKRPVFLRNIRPEEFVAPLINLENLDMEQRIKISLDWNFRYFWRDMFESSTVDIHEGKISFYLESNKDIVRYDVTRWDDEKIYCKRSATRPFTILENIAGGSNSYYNCFVKNGQLYLRGESKLMVFDVRRNRRIRKTGHFVRMRNYFGDIEVLDDGNILLASYEYSHRRDMPPRRRAVFLLENPG